MRVLKKAQGGMRKGTTVGDTAGDALFKGDSPHWSRDIPEGTVACEGAHAGTGTPLRGPWRGSHRSRRKKRPCTNPNLLHYHCLVRRTEHNLRGQGEKWREGVFPNPV